MALLPDTTLGQILAILLGGLLLTLAVILCLFVLLHPNDSVIMRGPRSDSLQLATLIDALHAAPPEARPVIAGAIHTQGLRIRLGPPNPACDTPGLDLGGREVARALAHLLPPATDVTVHHCPGGGGNELLEVRAPTLNAMFDIDVGNKIALTVLWRTWMPLIGALLFLFILVAILSAWAISRVVGPLRRLSQTVERFGREVAVAPLAEQGPREIRRAARTFNQMQQRISAAVADRTRMLAAISHDLRTPITRMRLRAELAPAGDDRDKTLRDLDLMRRMVDAALDFLRGAPSSRVASHEPAELVELGSLLQTLCDEASEAGADVTWCGTTAILCHCHPNALARALTNLIENACRYGLRARVDATTADGAVHIDVEDDGPGIPDHLQHEARQPFARLDAARALGDGVGLGLAIVEDIARLHHGTLQLRNAIGHGLRARLILPQTAPAPPQADAIRATAGPV